MRTRRPSWTRPRRSSRRSSTLRQRKAVLTMRASLLLSAAPAPAPAPARATVAAIDPSLVAGRGAQLGIAQQEAENGATNGTILPFDTSAYTLSGEASVRQAVKLAPCQYVALTLAQRANAITITSANPDAPTVSGSAPPATIRP